MFPESPGNGPYKNFVSAWTCRMYRKTLNFFEKMVIARLITYLVKFLLILSKIEGDKNILKREEVNVIYFAPLIMNLLILIPKWNLYS